MELGTLTRLIFADLCIFEEAAKINYAKYAKIINFLSCKKISLTPHERF